MQCPPRRPHIIHINLRNPGAQVVLIWLTDRLYKFAMEET